MKVTKEKTTMPTLDSQDSFCKCTVRGTVVSKIRTKTTLIFIVASRSSPTNAANDYLRFIASTNIAELDASFAVGDRVTVLAYIRTSKKYPNGSLVPISVKREFNRTEAAFAQEAFLGDVNEVIISGIVSAEPYTPNDNVSLISIQVTNPDGRSSYLRTISFGRVAQKTKSLTTGDAIEALAYVRTQSLKETKDPNKIQSIVLLGLR